MSTSKETALTGRLFGTAVGDAMGLACEGLSRRRQAKMFPVLNSYKFLFGKGMTSDDTEHTCMLAQSVIAHGSHPMKRNYSLTLRGGCVSGYSACPRASALPRCDRF